MILVSVFTKNLEALGALNTYKFAICDLPFGTFRGIFFREVVFMS